MTKKDSFKDKTDDESGGSSGQAGSIEFRDFITGPTSLRDDNLPPDELRRLRAVHNIAHELRVKKQKETRETRQDLKNGKITLEDYRQGMAAEKSSQYPMHPTLDVAQFSGTDPQVNMVPALNDAQTNDENRNELENRYQNKYQPEMGKKFNPRPQFP